MNRLLLAAALALVLPQAAHAQLRSPAPAAVPTTVPSTSDPAAAVFKAWDRNGDGQLSPVEFQAGWRQARTVAKAKAILARQFAAVDANHDRAIDSAEYGRLVLVRDAGKAAPLLARFDADSDGRLEFGEYVHLVEALAPRRSTIREAQK